MSKKFVCTIDGPIVDTKEGKLRGYCYDGIYSFKGVQYADAKRFQMPTPVEPWEGVKEATNYGYVCPINSNPAPTSELYIPHRFWPADEHCQNLNIWTPSICPNSKKPVMVWLHGGGFADGSSIEQVAYDGENLSKRGDVVVVTINHRLNILGFLDMSSYGEKYANSVNAGMADIVEALRWIHNNISSFGGDPDNVTIFGQSGGGGKVGTLLNIPAAAGLFHRAILMSGVISTLAQGEIDHRPLIDGIMKELNIPADQVELLEEVPYEILIRAYNKVNSDLAEHGFKNGWIPVANDWYLGDPMVVGFSDYAKTVPTMAGTVIAEFSTRNNLEVENRMTEEDKVAAITEKYGEDAPRIIELFKASYPGDDIQTILKIDRLFRPCTVDYIAKKAEESTAPAYLYQFTTTFDIKGGAPAWHCSDIPFVFYNTSLVPSADIENVTEKLEEEMAGAWVSFAYSGNPNHNGMVKWENYTAENKATMVFDANTRCVHDLDSEILEIVERHSNGGTLKDIMVTTAKSNKDTGASKREWIY